MSLLASSLVHLTLLASSRCCGAEVASAGERAVTLVRLGPESMAQAAEPLRGQGKGGETDLSGQGDRVGAQKDWEGTASPEVDVAGRAPDFAAAGVKIGAESAVAAAEGLADSEQDILAPKAGPEEQAPPAPSHPAFEAQARASVPPPPPKPKIIEEIPPPKPPEEEWKRFVDVAGIATVDSPKGSLIGEHSTASEAEQRTEVTSARAGTASQEESESPTASSQGSARAQAGEERVSEGAPIFGAGKASREAAVEAGQAAVEAVSEAEVATPEEPRGASAEATVGRAKTPASREGAGQGSEAPPPEGTPWWDAAAFRVGAAAPKAQPRVETPQPTIAKSPRRTRTLPRPVQAEVEPPAPEEEAPEEGVADVVEELQALFGWGGRETQRSLAPAFAEGSESAGASRAASGQVALEDALLASRAAVSAEDGALGRYQAEVYRVLRASWVERELSLAQRVSLPAGTTVVRFHVLANGKVEEVNLWKSSGSEALDRLALECMPKRLPKFSRELRESGVSEGIWQEFHFHYGRAGRSLGEGK